MDDLRKLSEQMEAMSARAETVAEEWSEREFTGSADNGGVVATVDPVGTLKALDISPLSKRRNDGVTLGDAVVAAIHAAEQAAAEAKDAMMRELGAGAGLTGLMDQAQRDFESRANLGSRQDPSQR
ncbi:YbaB/EbfC family nucleoid-associated protein [Nonomuraea sp. LPB2021202275-12-8]|uniref:YbaB/EbfC family nucleoid-associated protein n=1 Tax=Nonomuraea sp. LPB2021202275-12-8 TaxID=3120159 RepID=UPI00300C75E2